MGLRTVVGSASLKAEDWVNTFQNPFGQFLSQIFDPINAAQKTGGLKYQDAADALDQFNQQWTAFDAAAQQWRQKGGDYKTVVDQSYDPTKDFMKTVEMVRQSLTGWAQSLKPEDTGTSGPSAPPTAQTILGGLSPQTVADAAALRQRRAAQVGGRSSTILTGNSGLSELSANNRKYTTLLGYA